jgi:GNAT superfamily N-acetyltransferase
MKVRPALPADAGAIADLAGQLGYPTSADLVADYLETTCEPEVEAIYVAELPDAGVVGWIHVFGARRLMVEPFAEIGGLVVDEAHRAQGAGQLLLGQAEKWASSRGFGLMRVRSNVVRSEAHTFYEWLGYDRAKQQNVFVKLLERRASGERRPELVEG